MDTLRDIKKLCLVCQACKQPTWALTGQMAMTPLLPRVWFSVSLDVCFLPPTTYEGENYDCYLLCVDRHSGWMVARPTLEEGLTGRKAAQLLLDNSWGELGVPSIITTDLGTQFVSEWWKHMCARLGIRHARAEAYRHQTNGKAESAAKVIQTLLRKMHTQSAINWVEALPRVLRIQHDIKDPKIGMSPYQAMSGRERSLAALPCEEVTQAIDPKEFFSANDSTRPQNRRKTQ